MAGQRLLPAAGKRAQPDSARRRTVVFGDIGSTSWYWYKGTAQRLYAHDTTARFSINRNKFRCLKCLDLYFSATDMMFHAGAMLKLEYISFRIKPHSIEYACANRNLGIHHLSTLKEFGARVEEVEAVEAAIKNEASLLPNCSSQHMVRLAGKMMVTEGQEERGYSMEQQEEITSPPIPSTK
uniref:Disease resistance R13L4/SHOC-2-like LRR domain-containing protein n=1 Tax=Oryza barthii TaxID=65489 RepID=A0A0D3HP59_9ORYZ